MNRKLMLFFLFFLTTHQSLYAWDKIDIKFSRPQNTPYYVGVPEINVDAEEFNTVVLRIKSTKGGTARLFWATNFDPKMNEPKSVWFFLKKSNYYKEYSFNLRSQNPYWAGYVGQLLIYPDNGTDGVEIESAQAFTGNVLSNLKSGWQEFWGPRGRLVIGSTINTIQSSNVFGQSINQIIYWLIGLFVVGLLGWEIYKWTMVKAKKRPPFSNIIPKIGRKVLYAIIFFWAILEISSLYSQYVLQLKEDWKYVGKSQSAKLTTANAGDFYPFMEFCQKELPPRAAFDFRVSGIYNDIKIRYYLYPRKISTTEADYLVVYDASPEKEIESQYQFWRTFRPSAFIMKKK